MARQIRRVVTGHDEEGRAIVVSDQLAANILESPSRPGVALTNLWTTAGAPVRFDAPPGDVDRTFVMFPSGSQTLFRVTEFAPEDPAVMKTLDGGDYFAEVGAGEASTGSERHPFMHRTETLDYAIVLDGAITLVLDDSEIDLRAGDVVVQRGTNHAWANRGTETCHIAFILLGGAGTRHGVAD